MFYLCHLKEAKAQVVKRARVWLAWSARSALDPIRLSPFDLKLYQVKLISNLA